MKGVAYPSRVVEHLPLFFECPIRITEDPLQDIACPMQSNDLWIVEGEISYVAMYFIIVGLNNGGSVAKQFFISHQEKVITETGHIADLCKRRSDVICSCLV